MVNCVCSGLQHARPPYLHQPLSLSLVVVLTTFFPLLCVHTTVQTPKSQFVYNIVASNSDTLYTVGW